MIVMFYTFSRFYGERIYRHVDTCKLSSYCFETNAKVIQKIRELSLFERRSKALIKEKTYVLRK